MKWKFSITITIATEAMIEAIVNGKKSTSDARACAAKEIPEITEAEIEASSKIRNGEVSTKRKNQNVYMKAVVIIICLYLQIA